MYNKFLVSRYSPQETNIKNFKKLTYESCNGHGQNIPNFLLLQLNMTLVCRKNYFLEIIWLYIIPLKIGVTLADLSKSRRH
jgi:hypothetical protein